MWNYEILPAFSARHSFAIIHNYHNWHQSKIKSHYSSPPIPPSKLQMAVGNPGPQLHCYCPFYHSCYQNQNCYLFFWVGIFILTWRIMKNGPVPPPIQLSTWNSIRRFVVRHGDTDAFCRVLRGRDNPWRVRKNEWRNGFSKETRNKPHISIISIPWCHVCTRSSGFMIGLQMPSNSWQQSGSNIYKCSLEAFTEIHVNMIQHSFG